MLPRSKSRDAARVDLQMTPMIDVVFQLLIFFILSFRIVQAEGDLAIKLPLDVQPGPIVDRPSVPPLTVQLQANERGDLRSVLLNQREIADFAELRSEVEQVTLDNFESREEIRVDIQCDEQLKYENVIAALTAVSGRRDEAGRILPLASNVHLRAK